MVFRYIIRSLFIFHFKSVTKYFAHGILVTQLIVIYDKKSVYAEILWEQIR